MTFGTMERIQTVTVGSGGAANIEFTNIPQTYSDLRLVISARSNATTAKNEWLQLSLNGSTSNFTYRLLQGTGAAAFSYNGSTNFAGDTPTSASGTTASTFGSAELYIPNYAGNTNKSISSDSVTEGNYTDTVQDLTAILWSNTAAITSITLAQRNGSWLQYSTATLYGIKRT